MRRSLSWFGRLAHLPLLIRHRCVRGRGGTRVLNELCCSAIGPWNNIQAGRRLAPGILAPLLIFNRRWKVLLSGLIPYITILELVLATNYY